MLYISVLVLDTKMGKIIIWFRHNRFLRASSMLKHVIDIGMDVSRGIVPKLAHIVEFLTTALVL